MNLRNDAVESLSCALEMGSCALSSSENRSLPRRHFHVKSFLFQHLYHVLTLQSIIHHITPSISLDLRLIITIFCLYLLKNISTTLPSWIPSFKQPVILDPVNTNRWVIVLLSEQLLILRRRIVTVHSFGV